MRLQKKLRFLASILLLSILITSQVNSQDKQNTEELAKKLSNPVASLISVPFQFNFDFNINSKEYGGENGYKMLMNFQPVIPMSIGKKWNLINRVIIPIVTQKDVTAVNKKEEGLADITYTGFLSPAAGSIIWGIGPAITFPTSTNELLGSKKLILGPSFVILGQRLGVCSLKAGQLRETKKDLT